MRRISLFIHQLPSWPHFHWDHATLESTLGTVRHQQGHLLGRLEALGLELRAEATLESLALDVLKSSEIEGEVLPPESVRSSLAYRLGLNQAGLPPIDRRVEGVVAMMLDATQRAQAPLTAERLFGWHHALFPTGYSGMYAVRVGAWRTGPMQVVSGPLGREWVHFEAPAAEELDAEMHRFLEWFNAPADLDPVLKAAVAHFWFVTIHPFDDGNGRIARAIADLQLTRADGMAPRGYSMSAQIQAERQTYYDLLETSQRGTLDITPWLTWFLQCLGRALTRAEHTLGQVMVKARFWERHRLTPLTERQRLLVQRLLNGFEGKLTTSKWARMAKCSQDTAGRDIADLISKGILLKESAGGRSTGYRLAPLE
ncbi:Fic family protein [Hymenobacter sp. BT186]|uniref:Fic family protein n=1 Tax=Hymenobacter telluris TaxID=2816474 RepID=A0A939F0E4_9BACT|nr:Fic family protein [Hymenobacter telluris]MBO0360858.1 Fic family protein [Hymenobacter telluris]MBW3376887.1 Fic family protein [Hymenobacter norwichensis]